MRKSALSRWAVHAHQTCGIRMMVDALAGPPDEARASRQPDTTGYQSSAENPVTDDPRAVGLRTGVRQNRKTGPVLLGQHSGRESPCAACHGSWQTWLVKPVP